MFEYRFRGVLVVFLYWLKLQLLYSNISFLVYTHKSWLDIDAAWTRLAAWSHKQPVRARPPCHIDFVSETVEDSSISKL